MRKIALLTVASLFALAALPSFASQADRASGKAHTEEAEKAPYSGQIVIRGEVKNADAKAGSTSPAPYSGQIVHRGEVTPDFLG